MKIKFLFLVIFLVAVLSFGCRRKEDEMHFILQIDSVVSITSDSAIVYLTDLSFEQNTNKGDFYWHPMVDVNTTPNISIDMPTTNKIFSSTEADKKNYKIQLYGLKPNTTYYAVATAIGIDKSEEISFKTLSE